MCYRYVLRQPPTVLEERFKANFVDNTVNSLVPAFNAGPTHIMPVITGKEPQLIQGFKFGLTPHWSPTPSPEVPLLNARAETMDLKPSYKKLVNRQHCIVLADGFIEWKTQGKSKLPYLISFPNNEPFAMAGLWDEWSKIDGSPLFTFNIITIPANSYVQEVHDRMPLLLSPQNEKTWLSENVPLLINQIQDLATKEPLLLKPISPEVNSILNQGATVLNDAGENRQMELF